MNKQQELDIMVVRAKINAQKSIKKFFENWYAEEPKEVSNVVNAVSEADKES